VTLELSTLQQWIVVLTGCGSVASVAAGIWVKLRAESRMLAAQKIESDVKLLKLFSEMMNLAHARGAQVVSEQVLATALKDPTISALIASKSLDIADLAVITTPVGVAAQDAAIAAVAALGKKHEILRGAAIQGLETLSTWKEPVAMPFLDELKRKGRWGR